MRVMQLMAGAKHGGAELFFERLVMALGRSGVGQRAIIRTMPERAARLRGAGVDCTELPFGGPLDWRTSAALRREITYYQPDIALAWMSRAAHKLPRRRAGQIRPVLCARLGGYYPLKYYRRCDHLIGNTRDIVDYLIREGWPASRAHYLPNFALALPAPAIARAAFDTPAGAPLLLAMGRLHPNKGFDVLLAALTELPGAYLWIAGEGPEQQRLQAQAAQLGIAGRVRFLGWRDDTAALLASADMLVCPSRIEPLGNVVIEAWAHRKPVVAASAVGPAALIANGVNGLLAPTGDADGLARAIESVIRSPDLAAQLSASGHAAYAAQYTETAVVQAYRGFFERVNR